MRYLGLSLLPFFIFVWVADPIYYLATSDGAHHTPWHIFHHAAGFAVMSFVVFATWRWLARQEK